MIDSMATVYIGHGRGDVVQISNMRQGSAFVLCKLYQKQSVLLNSKYSLSARFIHLARVFTQQIDSNYPTTTLSVCNMHMISTATEETILPAQVTSATSIHGIPESQIHLLTITHTAQYSCARNLIPWYFGFNPFVSDTLTFRDWWIGGVCSSVTTLSWY